MDLIFAPGQIETCIHYLSLVLTSSVKVNESGTKNVR